MILTKHFVKDDNSYTYLFIVGIKCEFGGVQMTSYIETAKDSIS